MKKLIALILTAVLCLCCLASCTLFAKYSITYADKETERLLHDGYVPRRANPGDTVVLRAGPIMDADLYFYANGVQIENTHNDSDYWEYTFIMPDEDVVITHEMSGDGPIEKCNHKWDDGVEVEGEMGGYVMEYTCKLCGDKRRETITIIPPSGESHSISYQSDRTKELLMEGFIPTEARAGDTVVLRADPLMDADLAFYANGVKLTQTYADYDYWEYVFIMPDEDVVITHEITNGFLPD